MDAIERMENKSKKRDTRRVGIKMPVHNIRMQELIRNSIANNQKKARRVEKESRDSKYLTTAA